MIQSRRFYRTNSRVRKELIKYPTLGSPYATPLDSDTFLGLPPILLAVADKDLLFDDTVTLFKRIENEQGTNKIDFKQMYTGISKYWPP